MFKEKRRAERVEILGQLAGEVTVFQPLTITEVSSGGVQVETEFPLHIDSIHDFRLTLGDITVVVKGRVTHCRIADIEHERVLYRTGVEVIDPTDHVRQTLQEYIEHVKNFRSGPSSSTV
ncbi:MAG: PilZ domain-containing protein [Vicinamibacterales bacterium]